MINWGTLQVESLERRMMEMVDTKKDQSTVQDVESHDPPTTGKMSPGAGHSRTPTEDNEKDVVKKTIDNIKNERVKDVKDIKG